MNKKEFYKYGTRPIYSEENPKGIIRYYAYQWETGEFKEDMTYMRKIRFNFSGDKEDLTEEEFDAYVEKIRKKKTDL